ncbi:ABC transporter ATP-binding protein, partial [Enterococcus faecalis]|nr:ABC transporter ATP-binding protein [Enterococcus faecalis]
LITIVLITLQIPLNILVSYFCSKWSQLVIFDIRETLGNRVFSVKENSKNNGLFINTISNDCEVIGNELLAITLNSLPNLMLIILYLLVLLNLNLKLTIITLASIPMFVLISYITSKKVFSLTKELQQFRDKLIEFLNSYVRNKLIIDLYGIKAEEKNKFSDITRQVRDVNVKTSTILATLNNISSLLAVVTPLLILFIGSVLTIKREITLGTLVAFNSYTSLLFIPLTKLLNIPPMLSQLKVSVDRIKQSNFPKLYQEIGKYEEVSNLTENEQLIVKELNILIEDKYLLKKTLSFQINKGDVIEIQGPNGIGKSILLKSLINYHTNFIGTIKKRSQLNIVYVPQENFLFEGTVRSNLCKGIYKYDELELQKLIELVKFDVPLDKKVTPFSMNLSS